MSQTGTPTEFLQLGITEPDDTLNVLVDLNGQWRKIDTGVKNVDTKATTNAGNIATLQESVQDNTENITNILDTNVNQQNSIDTLQTKVATLEEDDTSYGSRITAVENGVQENSELINDLEVDLSGVKLDMGTVPSGSNLQGEVDGLDTRVTALENSGSVASVEARVTTLETEVGTVPAGETVQGQITTLNGQVNSGNIPFRFSVDGGGNYGYLKADDSFVPFSSGDSHIHEIDTTLYVYAGKSFILPYRGYSDSTSPNYKKLRDFIHNVDYTLPQVNRTVYAVGNLIFETNSNSYLMSNGTLNTINDEVVGVYYSASTGLTKYLTRNINTFVYNVVDTDGNRVGQPVSYTMSGASTTLITFWDLDDHATIYFNYSNQAKYVAFDQSSGNYTEGTLTSSYYTGYQCKINNIISNAYEYDTLTGQIKYATGVNNNMVVFNYDKLSDSFFSKFGSKLYYYI